MHPVVRLAKVVLAVAIPVLVTVAIYWPGLPGPFLLDDIVNLVPLASIADGAPWGDIARFVLTGISGPTGRPLSLATFLFNDVGWPSDAWSFKYTNLMIHLLNGMLLMLFAFKLLQQSPLGKRTLLPVIALTLLWLVHPLNVSTVLYVIQRMTELNALFTLLGLLAYLRGRKLLGDRPVAAYSWMTAAVVICGGLSMLCKENGVLLLVYICVLEVTLLGAWYENRTRGWHLWATLFLYVPLTVVAAYILWTAPGGYAYREFTLGERLLTESRVLRDYLVQILVPRLEGGGIYHDDYVVSKSLLSPADTLPSVLMVSVVVALGLWYRRRYPVAAFAVMWFFGGHLLESTVVPLEIYFEHRNYLPMIGPLFALIYWVFCWGHRRRVTYVANTGFALLLTFCAAITVADTLVWGSAKRITDVWAAEHPHSVRARQTIASYWGKSGNYERALRAVLSEQQGDPRNSALILEILYIKCMQDELESNTVREAIDQLTAARYSKLVFAHLSNLLKFVENGDCNGLNSENLRQLVEVLIRNGNFQTGMNRYQLEQALATLYIHDRFLSAAIEALDRAHAQVQEVDTPLMQAYYLSTAGLYDDALRYVRIAEETSAKLRNPFVRRIRHTDVEYMRKLIEKAKQKFGAPDEGGASSGRTPRSGAS